MNNAGNVVISHPHVLNTLQNTNAPDVTFDSDASEIEGAVLLGMETSEIDLERKIKIEVSTIFISALIFLAILAWFDFMQTTTFVWLSPQTQEDQVSPAVKFWYAILVTIVVIILVILIYYYTRNHRKKK